MAASAPSEKILPQMHFVRPVADPQQAPPGQRLMDRRIVGAAHRAEHLHGAVGDPLKHRRHRDFDQRHVAPGAGMAALVEPPRAAIREQPRLLELDADPARSSAARCRTGSPSAECEALRAARAIISSINSSHRPIERMQW